MATEQKVVCISESDNRSCIWTQKCDEIVIAAFKAGV